MRMHPSKRHRRHYSALGFSSYALKKANKHAQLATAFFNYTGSQRQPIFF
jgi:hypothetical protein